jgi:hypothetical protein
LLAGYGEVTALTADDLAALHQLALLFGVWKIAQQERKAVRKDAFIANLAVRVQRQHRQIHGKLSGT